MLWDLPTGYGPAQGHDALQWANLAKPDGWLRVSFAFVSKKMPQELGESGGWERLHFFRDIFYKNTGVH